MVKKRGLWSNISAEERRGKKRVVQRKGTACWKACGRRSSEPLSIWNLASVAGAWGKEGKPGGAWGKEGRQGEGHRTDWLFPPCAL